MKKLRATEGVTMAGLEERTGVGRRAVHGWMHAGLLPRPALRGLGAIYDEPFIERVLQIRELRREGLKLREIPDELSRRAAKAKVAKKLADAAAQEAAAQATTAAAGPKATTPQGAPGMGAVQAWERVVLVPGLELSYRTDAGEVLRRLVEEIWTRYGLKT